MSDIGFELADVDTFDPNEEAFDRMREKEHAAAIETCVAHGLDLRGVRYTALGEVAEDVAAGEPWFMTELAGLQFYDYGVWDEVLEERVMPRDGDRLSLVRAPDNPHDANAIEVWWNNGVRLGHLPRSVAAVVAGPFDLGLRCRAYIADGGTGEAWTAKAVLVGEAVRALHEKRIRHVVRRAIEEHEARERSAERRRKLVGDRNGHLFESELADRRRARIVQAAKVLLATVPLEVEPPPVGKLIELATIESLLGVSRSTARRIVERAGCPIDVDRRGWYATGSYVEVTAALQEAIRGHAARPLRIRPQDITLSSGSHLALRSARSDADADDIPF